MRHAVSEWFLVRFQRTAACRDSGDSYPRGPGDRGRCSPGERGRGLSWGPWRRYLDDWGGILEIAGVVGEKKKSQGSQCRALRAGELESAPPRLALAVCSLLPLPLRMESEHCRFSFETLFKAADFRFFSPICSSQHSSSLTPRHSTAQRASLHSCDSWLSLVHAERDAHHLQSWATQLWASSEWVIWARCMPGGSPTLAGGRCKVSSESACTVFICEWYVQPLTKPPPLHPDDLSAFGSSMAVWHLPYHLGVVDWAAVDDVKSQLP